MTESVTPSKRTKDRSPWKRILVAILLLVLLALLVGRCQHSTASSNGNASPLDSLLRADSLARLDSVRLARIQDSLARLKQAMEDSLRRLDSLQRLDSLRRAHLGDQAWRERRDRDRRMADSLARLDSLRLDSIQRARRALRDTTPPHIFADPAAGVHPAPIDVAVLTEEGSATPLCGPDTLHMKVCRDMIRVTDHLVLWISGRDTAGNRARYERMEYVIDPNASRCGPRRALVPMESGEAVCVDAYEYPNVPALPPTTSVNWDEASAICAKAGKRLCSLDELTTTCKGEHGWTYPYGDHYIPSHCQDVEGTLARGVAKPGCRSWWGAYNLVGNAWEWSSTPTGRTFFAVGGPYTGGPANKCGRTTRSFYRQNRYDAVGFRCCETLAASPVP